MRKFSIRQYVAWLTFIPLFIMAIGLESYFLHDHFSDMDRELLEKGRLVTSQLASSSEYGVFSNNLDFLQNIANATLQQADVRGVSILDSTFRVLVRAGEFSSGYTNEGVDFGQIRNRQLLAFAEAMGDSVVFHPSMSDGRSLWLYHPIVPAQIKLNDAGFQLGNNDTIKPTGSVIVEISRARHEEYKSRMLWSTLLATTLFLALTFYLVQIASRRITGPIRKLSDAVQAIGEGDLGTRVSIQTRVSELETLAQGMNEMTAQLQQEHAVMQQRVEEATHALKIKKEEAERASHDKSRFLAVASHDLRQPLHALGLYVAELQRKVSGADQQRLVEQVEHSIEALSALLNALLDISKLDAGAVIPQIQTCAVDAILKRIAADYQMLAKVKNIRLVVRPCAGYVTTDPLLLERILTNLVSNAIRYTYPNGSVMLACRRRKNSLHIEVRDNGIGISGADRDNIFREFFQVMQPQLDSSRGLGLGLAIVARLVKLLGHRIELRSIPGKGSVFSLEVPIAVNFDKSMMAANVQVAPNLDQESGKSALAGKRLLVVDDDAAVLSGTVGILASWGCQVSAAASVSQVEHFLHDGLKWDLIISDYQLENNTNGIEVIDLVREHQHQQIPCILISGDISPAVLKLASVSGHHLLHKPVRPAKLRSLIEHLLDEDTQ